MICVLIATAPTYLGLVWLLGRVLGQDAVRRKRYVAAAAVALAAAALVLLAGVPYARNPQDRVGVPLALALIAFGPFVFTRLGRRSRWGVALVAALVFAEPAARAEYLTWRHGSELRAALLREHPDAGAERIFGVLSRSPQRAVVLRVECSGTGYTLDFEKDASGLWRLTSSYPPEQLLWYEGSSGWYDYPYPTSVLLAIHRGGVPCGAALDVVSP